MLLPCREVFWFVSLNSRHLISHSHFTMATKRHQENGEFHWTQSNEDQTESRCLYSLLKPLLVSMKICGLLHSFHPKHTDEPAKKKKWETEKVYSLVMMIILILNVLRLPTNLATGDPLDLPIKIITAIWTLQCALNRVALHATFSGCNIQTALLMWKEQFKDPLREIPDIKKRFTKPAKRLILLLTLGGWSFMLSNIGFLLFSTLGPIMSSRHMMALVVAPLPESLTSRLLGFGVFCMTSLSWVFPILYVVCICYIISQEFDLLKLVLQKHISSYRGSLPPKLEQCRRQHVTLCKIVAEFDSQLKFLFLVSYMTNIPLSCFLCYRLAKVEMQVFNIFLHCLWIGTNIANVTIPGLAASVVHEKVSIRVTIGPKCSIHVCTFENLRKLFIDN